MKASPLAVFFFVLSLIVVVVAVDVLFLRHNVVARLITNIAIVLVYIALYYAFIRR